ncbi:hypothetical protein ABIA55_004626 [Pseudomonas frederiksbergensis]
MNKSLDCEYRIGLEVGLRNNSIRSSRGRLNRSVPFYTEVNIDTDLRLASTGAMRRLMATNPSEFDPRKFFGATVTAMRDVCIARYEQFGTAGNASKIKPISLEAMYQRYLKGELSAKVN